MKGVKSIKGNTNPQIGANVSYEVDSLYPGTTIGDYSQVKWKLYTKETSGVWRELKGTLKTGKKVSFSFPQKWLGKQLLVEAYLNAPEKKSPPGLIISPIQGERKITHLFLRDANNKVFTTPPKYGENVKLNIHTQNLYNEIVTVQVLERDTISNSGHDANENTLLDTFRIKISNLDGKVSQTISLNLAWRVKAKKGALEGNTHEYYLRAIAPQTRTVISTQTTDVQDKAVGERSLVEQAVGTVVGIIDGIAKAPGENSTLVGVGNQQTQENNGCGQKYCIDKSTPPNELIREINIRLSGFGGNIPTDSFTDMTEKMIKQFQRDYMKVPETGKICGNVLNAIDDFCTKWSENITTYTCLCNSERAVRNKCSGFGKGQFKGQYSNRNQIERYHKYERPGMHRSLLWGVSALKFYLSTQETYKYLGTTAGYRCWEHNTLKGRSTTNHMGKAVDLQFTKNGREITGKKESNLPILRDIRDKIFTPYLDSKYQWVNGTNKFCLEPFGTGSGQTWSWIHMDVREFENTYLDDKYFIKTQAGVIGKSVVQLAIELGFRDTCNCSAAFKPQKKSNEPATSSCDDKFKRVAPIILKHEGGYVNHKSDKGGATNKGITIGTWTRYAKEDLNIEPTLDNLKNITDEQATLIYRKRYWEPKGFCKVVDERVGLMVYDWTITSGGAGKQIQRLLKNEFNQNINDDGAIGPKTIEAINNVEDQDKLLTRIAEIRKQYYINLTYTDGVKNSQDVFLKGWLNRVDDCLEFNP